MLEVSLHCSGLDPFAGSSPLRLYCKFVKTHALLQAPWQKKDYKLLPQQVVDHEGAEGPQGWTSMPAVEVMPVQVSSARTSSLQVVCKTLAGGGNENRGAAGKRSPEWCCMTS